MHAGCFKCKQSLNSLKWQYQMSHLRKYDVSKTFPTKSNAHLSIQPKVLFFLFFFFFFCFLWKFSGGVWRDGEQWKQCGGGVDVPPVPKRTSRQILPLFASHRATQRASHLCRQIAGHSTYRRCSAPELCPLACPAHNRLRLSPFSLYVVFIYLFIYF